PGSNYQGKPDDGKSLNEHLGVIIAGLLTGQTADPDLLSRAADLLKPALKRKRKEVEEELLEQWLGDLEEATSEESALELFTTQAEREQVKSQGTRHHEAAHAVLGCLLGAEISRVCADPANPHVSYKQMMTIPAHAVAVLLAGLAASSVF